MCKNHLACTLQHTSEGTERNHTATWHTEHMLRQMEQWLEVHVSCWLQPYGTFSFAASISMQPVNSTLANKREASAALPVWYIFGARDKACHHQHGLSDSRQA